MNTPKETQTNQIPWAPYAETFGGFIIRTATRCPTGGHPLLSAIVRINTGDEEEQLSPGQAMRFALMIMSAARVAAEWNRAHPATDRTE